MPLNEKQRRFCDEYLIDMNGAQAALRAGYSKKNSNVSASSLLTNPNVVEYLQIRREILTKKLEISQEWVLERLKSVSDRCMTAEPVMIYDGKEWVESGEYKFDSTGVNRSTELIGKHLGMFTQKVDLTTNGESLNDKRPSVKLPDGTTIEL